MVNALTVRRLTVDDAVAFQALRREALEREPFAFGSSTEDDRFRSVDLVRETLLDEEQAVIGAFADDLIGTVGVRRLKQRKVRHKAEIWGMYIRQEHRRAGIGRRLLQEAIRFARGAAGVTHLHLTVTAGATAAAALYERVGFVVWGIEPAGLKVEGVDLAERHMVMVLDGPGT